LQLIELCPKDNLIIDAGALFAGFDQQVKKNVRLSIWDGKVQSIKKQTVNPREEKAVRGMKTCRVISANNMTVVPGLLDCHVHLALDGLNSSTPHRAAFSDRIRQKLISDLAHGIVAVQALQKDLCGSLVLGASTIPGEYILPAALGRFQELHPQVKAKLEIADSTEIGQLIMDAKLEAGMIGVALDNPVLCQEHIANDELVVIASCQHHLANKSSVAFEDILEEPLIVREAGSGTQLVIESKLRENGIAPERLNVRLELGSTAAVVNAVAAGLGLSLVSRFAVKNRINAEDIAVLNIEGLPLERGLYFVTRKDQVVSPLVEAFYNFFKDYLQVYTTH
jgi:DNA-binding transcriptional LysR family regulator